MPNVTDEEVDIWGNCVVLLDLNGLVDMSWMSLLDARGLLAVS